MGDVRACLRGFCKQVLRSFACIEAGWAHLAWCHAAKQIYPGPTGVGSIRQVSTCSTSHSPVHPICLRLTSRPPSPRSWDPVGLHLQHLSCGRWEDFSRASLLPTSAAICKLPVSSFSRSWFLQVVFWGPGAGKPLEVGLPADSCTGLIFSRQASLARAALHLQKIHTVCFQRGTPHLPVCNFPPLFGSQHFSVS